MVQIQFNYLDYDDPAVQSRECYEVCRKFGKPVLVMEPVKGGSLVKLPEAAQAVLDGLHGGSPASYALRFAAGFPGIAHGALRHEQHGADAGQPLLHDRISGRWTSGKMAAVKQVQEIFRGNAPDSLHRLPLLHGGLPEAHLHSQPLCRA